MSIFGIGMVSLLVWFCFSLSFFLGGDRFDYIPFWGSQKPNLETSTRVSTDSRKLSHIMALHSLLMACLWETRHQRPNLP